MRNLFLALLFVISATAQVQGEITTIDLSNAIELGLRNSPEIRKSESQVQAMKYQFNQSLASFWMPDFTLNATIPYLDTAQNGNNSVSVNIEKKLFSGFTLSGQLSSDKIDIEMAEISLTNQKKDLTIEIQKLINGLFLIKKNIEITANFGINLKERLNFIIEKNKLGLKSDYDKIVADVQFKKMIPKMIELSNNYELLKMKLCEKIGLQNSSNYEFIGNTDLTNADNEILTYDDSFKNILLANDYDCLSIDSRIQKLKLSRLSSDAYKYPILSTFLNYNYNIFTNYNYPSYNTIYAGVQLSIPVMEWLPFSKTANKVNKIDEEIKQLEYEKSVLLNDKVLLLESMIMNYNALKKLMASQVEIVKQSKIGLDIAREKYNIGSITIVELSDAETLCQQEEILYYQEIYEIYTNNISYKRILNQ